MGGNRPGGKRRSGAVGAAGDCRGNLYGYPPAVSWRIEGRHEVCAISPLTGIWGESNSGGFWGAELKFAGYDGIVIANAINAPAVSLSRSDIFLALAKQVPGDNDGELIENPYEKWSDVNPELPDVRIEVLGPPPTSGTRDAFVLIVWA